MHIRTSVSCTSPSGNTTMDTMYPEPMSLLHRRMVPKKRRGKSSRYRTQPVTFSEIQEVDEENILEEEPSAAVSSRSEQDINRRFEEFIKSREKILGKIEPKKTLSAITPVDDKLGAKGTSCPCPSPPSSSRFTSRPSI